MTSSCINTSPSEARGRWNARLSFDVLAERGRSVVGRRSHTGPLVIQRPFHPEPDGTCHVYVVHPPGGLVSGDSLELDVRVGPCARALLTSPAATKLYRARASSPAPARQRVSLILSNGAHGEWLPQESIVFDGADAELSMHVELAEDATFLGWEIACLGRPAAGERFTTGRLVQRWHVRRANKLVYVDRLSCEGGDELLDAAFGLQGEPVLATLVAVTGASDEGIVEHARAAIASADGPGLCSITTRNGVTLARYLGPSVEVGKHKLTRIWAALRERMLGKAAVAPRIWAT